MKKCVIYARYSSERQTEQSIEGHLRVCYEFAKNNELTDLIRPDAEKRRAFLFYKFSKDVVMKRRSNLPLEKKTIRFEMYA